MRAGALQKLDASKLTGLDDIEPGLKRLQTRYPYSRHAVVPYTWGTIGITYNAAMIAQRQADAPVNSLDLLFKPELAARFADCGISVIDSPDEVLAVVLNYLGRDPRSAKAEDLAAATALLSAIKPYIRKFQSQPVTDLVNGNLCLSLGYSGDVTQSQRAAAAAGKPVDFQYRIPREGTTVWMDTMAIPVDARNPEYAYAFINFVMRPGEHGRHQQLHRLPHFQRQGAADGGRRHARQPGHLRRRCRLRPADSWPRHPPARRASPHACLDQVQDLHPLK